MLSLRDVLFVTISTVTPLAGVSGEDPTSSLLDEQAAFGRGPTVQPVADMVTNTAGPTSNQLTDDGVIFKYHCQQENVSITNPG